MKIYPPSYVAESAAKLDTRQPLDGGTPYPGMAKTAYEAWCNSWPKGTLTHPKWSELSEQHQCAWVAAALAVRNMSNPMDSVRLDWLCNHSINTSQLRASVRMAFDLWPNRMAALRKAIDEEMGVSK